MFGGIEQIDKTIVINPYKYNFLKTKEIQKILKCDDMKTNPGPLK